MILVEKRFVLFVGVSLENENVFVLEIADFISFKRRV